MKLRAGAWAASSPWMWQRYCLDPEFHAYDHTACPEALTDLYTMYDKIHGEGSAESAKAQLDWQCFYKSKAQVLNWPQETTHGQCSKDGLGGMVWNVYQALSSWAGISRYASSGAGNFCLLLWKSLVYLLAHSKSLGSVQQACTCCKWEASVNSFLRKAVASTACGDTLKTHGCYIIAAIMNYVQHRVLCRAPLAYARTFILRMHTSTASLIISSDVLVCSIAWQCVLAQRAYAH